MSLNTETVKGLSMRCVAPITQAYDGVICTQCNKWSASMGTDDPSDLFYLASRASRRGEHGKAIEYGEEAVRLLLRDPASPVEIEFRLERTSTEAR